MPCRMNRGSIEALVSVIFGGCRRPATQGHVLERPMHLGVVKVLVRGIFVGVSDLGE